MNTRSCKKKIFLLFVIFQCIACFRVCALDEKYAALPLRGSSIAADSTSFVQDTVFFNLSLRPTQIAFSVRNYITFKIDEFANLLLPDSFNLSISFKVYFKKYVGGSVVQDSSSLQTLSIDYNKFRNYQSKAVYSFTGGYESEVKIFSVTPSSSFSPNMNAIMVENEIEVTRSYAFDPNVNTVQSISGVLSSTIEDVCNNAGDFLVSWGKIRPADEYDLEWTYIDSSAIANYYLPSTTTIDPKKIFANNASRVSISRESYMIPLLYDNGGMLFFRVYNIYINCFPANSLSHILPAMMFPILFLWNF